MKRRIPGLHSTQPADAPLEGLFLVRVEWASYRWNVQKAYLSVRFVILEPKAFQNRSFSGPLLQHGTGALETELVLAGLRL